MSSVPGSGFNASEVSNRFALVLTSVDRSGPAILAMVTSVRPTVGVSEMKAVY